jgi:hypothetical protein
LMASMSTAADVARFARSLALLIVLPSKIGHPLTSSKTYLLL